MKKCSDEKIKIDKAQAGKSNQEIQTQPFILSLGNPVIQLVIRKHTHSFCHSETPSFILSFRIGLKAR
jgi:hypothetical protein